MGLVNIKERRDIEQKKNPFANGKIFEVKFKTNKVKAERANAAQERQLIPVFLSAVPGQKSGIGLRNAHIQISY